eukprot:8257103-Pyramimonas_sp.AAC.1
MAQPTAPQPLACPTAWPTERPCEPLAIESDSRLMKGNAPTPSEWRDAWAVLSEGISLRKSAR